MKIKSAGINDKRFVDNDFKTDEYLQVNSCGYYKEIHTDISIQREFGRRDYQIIMVISGGVLLNNLSVKLSDNEFCVLSPNTPNDYTYLANTYALWIHFSGSKVADILNEYKITPNQGYAFDNSYECCFNIEKIIDEFTRKHIGYMNNCNGYLLNLLTMLGRNVLIKNSVAKDNERIDKVIKFINDNLSKNISVADCAELLCVSESRLSHIFKEATGMSTQNYIIRLKIKYAQDLLSTTSLSINSVAEILGYDDALYFSRLFKKQTGISPMKYRKKQ